MDNVNLKECFIPSLGIVQCDNFSKFYPIVNKYIMENEEWQESRDGRVKELLNVKTTISNPYRRLSGGYGRNINAFFLLAEAMWIFLGRKDVHFLTMFNKNMAAFSDDGTNFHAPYGFRLRHWGIASEDKFLEENLHAAQGYDQVADAIKIFSQNPNTRQVVLSIWNPNLDLGAKTKDIPCNDMIMLKIRNGKLVTTIQNRSNDLHWGLPTNVFQFSFLTEIISACLGIELGTQTHNSQSLHVYEWNKIADTILDKFNSDNTGNHSLYDVFNERKIDFNFSHEVPANRLREVDYHLSVILDNLMRVDRGENDNTDEIRALYGFSKYLYHVYQYLKIYLEYKAGIKADKSMKSAFVNSALSKIDSITETSLLGDDWDVLAMVKNFFAKKSDTFSDSKWNLIGEL